MRIRHLTLTVALSLGLTVGLLVILGGQARPVQADPTTRYVSLAGSDAGDCAMAACRTIQYAVGQAINGDEIRIAAGIYTEALNLSGRNLAFAGAGAAATFIDGGGSQVMTIGSSSVVTITGLTIQNGYDQFYGGGIYVFGDSACTLESAVLFNNQAGNTGGAIAVSSGRVTLTDTTVVSNTSAQSGGGIGVMNSDNVLILANSAIISNTAVQFSGGGIYNNGVFTLTNSAVVSNRAPSAAGIYIESYGVATLDSATIAANVASSRVGGIRIQGGGVMQLINSTVSSNSAAGSGGGISNWGILTATHTTIAANWADSEGNGSGSLGGYAGNGGQATFWHTLIADNRGQYGAPDDCANSGTLTSQGYNLVETVGNCVFSATGDITSTDPLLGPLTNNGGSSAGPVWTHALLAGSPAFDAGDPAFTSPPQYDQRGPGFPRVIGLLIDIGAFEAWKQVFLPVVLRN